ncbi:rhodanese-like domain-containing protein [Gallaecimonas kandeliae]|uniref:rhodanese-like domain-containing protein n=1 Tax=Gallaecimonas kandeliae TaxID=3029055 RepID=UPI0026490E8B|nr:rhodanese-like domain-containing protein [Gallaecimonas kandeliae]WKE64676.1 rhodanese-like domain-containing protein [Gallaecimonas kandeliae]
MQHSPGFQALCEQVRAQVREVQVDELEALLAEAGALLLDVREDHEWVKGRLPRAEHLGRGILERDIEKRVPDKATSLYLYCGGGYRSALAAHNLQLMGYTAVFSVAGGYKAWVAMGGIIAED